MLGTNNYSVIKESKHAIVPFYVRWSPINLREQYKKKLQHKIMNKRAKHSKRNDIRILLVSAFLLEK